MHCPPGDRHHRLFTRNCESPLELRALAQLPRPRPVAPTREVVRCNLDALAYRACYRAESGVASDLMV